MTEKKFDCWTCRWKREIPGDCHIACAHPSLKGAVDDPIGQLLGALASGRRIPVTRAVDTPQLNVRGNPAGIRGGWFNFPFNFDPVWLENCDGYQVALK